MGEFYLINSEKIMGIKPFEKFIGHSGRVTKTLMFYLNAIVSNINILLDFGVNLNAYGSGWLSTIKIL